MTQLLNNCKEHVENYQFRSEDPKIAIDDLFKIIKMLDIRKEERLNNFLDITIENPSKRMFFALLISEIKGFKIKTADRNKSNKDIQKIIEESHREIIRKHILEYLKSN